MGSLDQAWRAAVAGIGAAWLTVGCTSAGSDVADASDASGDGDGATDADADADADSDADTDPDTDGTAPSATGETADTGGTSPTAEPPWDSTDRTLFFGESRCATAGALVCDGFEGGAIDPALWIGHPWAPGPELDPTRAARGGASLHFHADENGYAALLAAGLFPVADDTYWGRMFVWFDALPTAPDWAHWTIVGATGVDVPGEIRVGGQFDPFFGGNRIGVGSDGGATGDWMYLDGDNGPRAVPSGEWLCVEWLHDGANDETRLFWDAVEHPSLATTASHHGGSGAPYVMPTFDTLWIGWWLYQGNPSPDHFDVWIDEVAFDDARVGCVR